MGLDVHRPIFIFPRNKVALPVCQTDHAPLGS
jgi:hypothetical protein